jgi:hypothetical protein
MLAEREFALVNFLVVLVDEELPLLHQLAAKFLGLLQCRGASWATDGRPSSGVCPDDVLGEPAKAEVSGN